MTVRDTIRALLADGQWHGVDEILRTAWNMLPPETAFKRWHRRGPPAITDMEARVAWGRRNFILGTLYDLRSDEHIVSAGYDSQLRVMCGPRWDKIGRRVAESAAARKRKRDATMTARATIRALLADGQWHGVEEILQAAWLSMPPERALKRWASRSRLRPRDWSTDDKIAWARKDYILDCLYDMKRDGHIECDGLKSDLRCRKGPRWGMPGLAAGGKRASRQAQAAQATETEPQITEPITEEA